MKKYLGPALVGVGVTVIADMFLRDFVSKNVIKDNPNIANYVTAAASGIVASLAVGMVVKG